MKRANGIINRFCLFLLGALVVLGGEPEYHNYLERFLVEKFKPSFKQNGSASIHVNVTTLQGAYGWVAVSIAGVADPSDGDILALFAPANAYWDGSAPVKYEFLTADPHYLTTGTADLSFRLLNLRTDMRFMLISGGLRNPSAEAEGPIIHVHSSDIPTGIHLLVGERPSETRVQWTTARPGSPAIKFGTRSGQLEFLVPAMTTTYSRDDLCGAPATTAGWLDPGQINTGSMTELASNTRYYYAVGDLETDTWSEEYTFMSHPGIGADVSVSFLAVADQGVGEPDGSTAAFEYQAALEVADRMADDVAAGYDLKGAKNEIEEYSLIVHNGDISYARGYSALWDTFFLQQAPVATRVPYATTPGNHEIDWADVGMYPTMLDSGGECGVPYATRFPMPTASLNKPWYSFDYGPIHFTVISSEHDFMDGSPQYHWISSDLGGVDREVTPWLLLVSHRPIYINADDYEYPAGKQTTALQLQTALGHLLDKHRVDVALAGHHHSYQRTCPVYKNKCKWDKHGRPAATVHVCNGHGGADFYDNPLSPTPKWSDTVFWTTHGHLRMHANGTHFSVEAVDRDDGEVFDSFTLSKVKSHPHMKDKDESIHVAQVGRKIGATF